MTAIPKLFANVGLLGFILVRIYISFKPTIFGKLLVFPTEYCIYKRK